MLAFALRFRVGWLALALVVVAPSATHAAAADPALGKRGMVVTSQVEASRAGLAMLEAGGNAVDAAVAAGFALGVVQPFSTGIGGGAFILIRTAAGEVVALDARETAPASADRDMYVREGVPETASRFGPLAVATPGLVAGLALALAEYGTLPLAQVMAPAIRLAAEGFPIGPYHVRMLERLREYGMPERFPETARIQYPPPGETLEVGWRLVQADLAASLRRIAAEGPGVFYRGDIARAIALHLEKNGGLVTREDLAGYAAKRRRAVTGSYRGYELHSFPPPSSGGVALVESLNILEGFELGKTGAGSSASIHRVAEAMKLAFADRAVFLGDPDFVEVPVARLVSKPYAAELRARLLADKAIAVPAPGQPADDAGTTHLSVTDAAGNAVAITLTINTPFGSGITVPGTGIVLNNEMDDFAVAPYTPNAYGLIDTNGANAIAPGKRPLSSMTPTIVVKDGKTFMVTGSPGGPRIITTALLTILNVIDFGMDVQAAVSAPRFHHQWVPDTLYLEPETPADVVEGLQRRGHAVEVSPRHWSSAQAIVVDAEAGWQLGGSDPRSDGRALGF